MTTTPFGPEKSLPRGSAPAKPPWIRRTNWFVRVSTTSTPALDRSARKYLRLGASTQLMSNAFNGLSGMATTARSWKSLAALALAAGEEDEVAAFALAAVERASLEPHPVDATSITATAFTTATGW